MIKIIAVTEYNKTVADRIRQLLIQLSRSGKDKGEISQEWFEQLISSPWHDLLLAVESAEDGNVKQGLPVLPEQILGMASVSVIFGAGIGKNAYLEDFVVDQSARGKGIGNLLFNAYEDWQGKKAVKISNSLVVKAARLPSNSIGTTVRQPTTLTSSVKS